MRRTFALVAAGLLAVTVPVIIGITADAETEQPRAPKSPPDTLEIGTTEDADVNMFELAEREQVLTYPGSSYVKLHFSRLLLAEGDSISVTNIDGTERHEYSGPAESLWTKSISGDTAVVKLNSSGDLAKDTISSLGANIDKVARGYTESEMDQRAAERPRTESVCGKDDSLEAVCYSTSHPDIYANTTPVARLLINGTTLCTAFRVGENNRMLTNNHCFDNDRAAANTEVWFNYSCAECNGSSLNSTVKVNGDDVLATDKTYDYTLFTVDDFDAIRDFGYLTLADRKAKKKEGLYIPQHPSGDPTRVAMESDADEGACEVDDPDYEGYAPASDVSYFCDTEFGSSGSPVLSRDTHEVVALHHFGGCPNSGVRSDKLLQRIGDKL